MQLANIVDGLRAVNRKDKNAIKTTLIVVPSSLVNQWLDEIKLHCDEKYLGEVLEYTAQNRLKTSNTSKHLQQFEVVITTYSEVIRSYPTPEFPPELENPEEKKAYWKQFLEENKGPLHRTEFLRVVLDEAQVCDAGSRFETQS